MSKTYPPSRSSRPASFASSRPRSDKSTSVQPVNRFSLFHVLSPCLRSTSLCISRNRVIGLGHCLDNLAIGFGHSLDCRPIEQSNYPITRFPHYPIPPLPDSPI